MARIIFLLGSADLEQTPQLRREKGGQEREVTSLRGDRERHRQGPTQSPPRRRPSSSPGFPLAIDQQVVEEEEGPLLDVARRDF